MEDRAEGARPRRVVELKEGVPAEYRTRPCARCPWRVDADLTDFTDRDMEMLERADGRPGAEAPIGAPSVACHKDQPGTSREYRWCAGWLAVVGRHSIAMRIALLMGALPPEAFEAAPDWPGLHEDLASLLRAREHQLAARTAPGGDTGPNGQPASDS